MRLDSFLNTASGEHVVWRYRQQLFTIGELQKSVALHRDQSLPQGARVALELDDPVQALIWMLALDGCVSSVFLVPSSLIATPEYPKLRNRAMCSHVVTTEGISPLDAAVDSHSHNSQVETSWILATSGTTGTPKLIEHSTASLTRTCKTDVSKGGQFTWGLVYDPFRFAGLQVVLQAFFAGSVLVICDPQQDIRSIVRDLDEGGVNALSATPSFWRKLLMSGEAKKFSFRQITLGGEPADQSVLDALAGAFPGARIAHIYASTEVGVGFSIKDGKAGFPSSYLDKTGPYPHFAISPEGTLLIKLQPSSLFPDKEAVAYADPGFVDSGDLVEIKGSRVYFLGRESGAINVGGNKVIPEQVETVIRAVPGVSEVLVKPKASGVMGQLVSAEVVLTENVADKKVLKKDIVAHCKANLQSYQVPALIRFVDQIQVNTTGKIKRT